MQLLLIKHHLHKFSFQHVLFFEILNAMNNFVDVLTEFPIFFVDPVNLSTASFLMNQSWLGIFLALWDVFSLNGCLYAPAIMLMQSFTNLFMVNSASLTFCVISIMIIWRFLWKKSLHVRGLLFLALYSFRNFGFIWFWGGMRLQIILSRLSKHRPFSDNLFSAFGKR